MTNPFPMPSRSLKNPGRLMQQGVWLLAIIALSLLLVMRHSGNLGSGSFWIVGCAVGAFLLSLTLRDAARKLGHRSTEDKIVKDVKNFLENQPALEVHPPAPVARPVVVAKSAEEVEEVIPRQATNFLSMSSDTQIPSDDLVVFDVIRPAVPVQVHMNFFPVMAPVMSN